MIESAPAGGSDRVSRNWLRKEPLDWFTPGSARKERENEY